MRTTAMDCFTRRRAPRPRRPRRHLRHRTARRAPPDPAARTRTAARSTASPPPTPAPNCRAAPTGASRRAPTSKTRPSPSTASPPRSRSTPAAAPIGIGELTETGELTFTELARVRTHRNQDKSGQYRWYNDYRLPDRYGDQTITVRLHGTRRRRGPQAQPHRERPTHPAERPRLRPPLPAPQRLRVDQPQPRRHPLDRTSPQRRPRPPTPQPPRLRAHGQRPRAPPTPATPHQARRLRPLLASSRRSGFARARMSLRRPSSRTDALPDPTNAVRAPLRTPRGRGFLPGILQPPPS